MLHMRNLLLAFLHERAGSCLKEATVIFMERKYFNKMFCPWAGALPCSFEPLIPRAKMWDCKSSRGKLPSLHPPSASGSCWNRLCSCQTRKISANLCSWSSSLKSSCSWPCPQAPMGAGSIRGTRGVGASASPFTGSLHCCCLRVWKAGAALRINQVFFHAWNAPCLTDEVKLGWNPGSVPPTTLFCRADGPSRD